MIHQILKGNSEIKEIFKLLYFFLSSKASYHFQMKGHSFFPCKKKKKRQLILSIQWLFLDCLLHPSNAGRWSTRQWTDFHRSVRQRGAQGIPAQAVIMMISPHSSRRFFAKPSDALPTRNPCKHDHKQTYRLIQRQEGSFSPVFPKGSIGPSHVAVSLPAPAYNFTPVWKHSALITYLPPLSMLYQI